MTCAQLVFVIIKFLLLYFYMYTKVIFIFSLNYRYILQTSFLIIYICVIRCAIHCPIHMRMDAATHRYRNSKKRDNKKESYDPAMSGMSMLTYSFHYPLADN